MKPVTAVVLAAGESRRMGRAKLLLPWGDTTVLGQTLRHVTGSDVDATLVVTGAYRAQVAAQADVFGAPCVHNPRFAVGEMVSSLQVALPHLAPGHAALVMLGDLPLVSADTINQILAAYRQSDARIVAPVYDGQRGHPVLFAPSLFEALLALPAGASAPREVVRRYRVATRLVAVTTDAILIDIDTPARYEQYRPIL